MGAARRVRTARRRSSGAGSAAFRTTARGNDEATGNNDTVTITIPGTVANLDVMVVCGAMATGTYTQSISGGGSGVTWSQKFGPIEINANLRAYLWTARATASSAGSTITLSAGAARRFEALLMVGSGVTDTGVLTANATVTTEGTSHAFPSVTVPAAGGYALLGFAAMRTSSADVASLSGGEPASTTLQNESNTLAPSSPNVTVSGLWFNTTVASGSRTVGTASSKLMGSPSTAQNASSVLFTVGLAPA